VPWKVALRASRNVSIAVAVALFTGCGGDDTDTPTDEVSSTTAARDPLTDGTSVDIGGRSLFARCRGTDGPTIVFEAGLTGDQRTWDRVLAAMPSDARVCVYDRTNTGRSETAPKPRTAQDVVDDLDALTTAIGEKPPFVLVGFSFGGIFAQLYAAQHPDDIAGLVLVESNHPDEATQIEAHLTPEQIAIDRAEAESNPEGIDIYASFDEVGAAAPLPSVPLVVVTATGPIDWPPGWDREIFDRLRAEQQADLAARIPGGQHVFADNSGHDVPREQPDVIVDAISRVRN
jgi:pimeloyl-ACP methyl ester carboxylesterase